MHIETEKDLLDYVETEQTRRPKLYIALVGLPASGKSTIAKKLRLNLISDGISTQIFNNGDLRRKLHDPSNSDPDFFSSQNAKAARIREELADINLKKAKRFLKGNGYIAILDATNSTRERRKRIEEILDDHPLLFIECSIFDEDLISISIIQKTKLSEFSTMPLKQAYDCFQTRLNNYRKRYESLKDEKNILVIDSLSNKILKEWIGQDIPYYPIIRNILVTDLVKNLYLARHGETFFNTEDRIGGDSELTEKGHRQAVSLAEHFKDAEIKYIFTSTKIRTRQVAEHIKEKHPGAEIISLEEFDEIDAGICEKMSYDEIRKEHPGLYAQRATDKYNFIYPKGEGYVTLRERVFKGLKKALYLSSGQEGIIIIGHQAVNRMILSLFLYQYKNEIPNIYIPQDKYFHIIATQNKKLFELKKFFFS